MNSTSNWAIPPKGSGLDIRGVDDHDPNFKPRFHSVKYKRPLTGAEMTFDIPYLDDLQAQDILSWRDQFRICKQTAGWSEAFALDYLEALTHIDFHCILVSEIDLE